MKKLQQEAEEAEHEKKMVMESSRENALLALEENSELFAAQIKGQQAKIEEQQQELTQAGVGMCN